MTTSIRLRDNPIFQKTQVTPGILPSILRGRDAPATAALLASDALQAPITTLKETQAPSHFAFILSAQPSLARAAGQYLLVCHNSPANFPERLLQLPFFMDAAFAVSHTILYRGAFHVLA